jgi:stage V sporulation protein R
MGIEFLWNGPVKLETSEPVASSQPEERAATGVFTIADIEAKKAKTYRWQRVLYTMKNRKLSRTVIGTTEGETAAGAVA